MVSKYPILPLVDLVTIHDTKRKPITKSKRISGIYPYYGASGITDYVEGFVFDGLYVLLAEDGDNLRTRNTPIAFTAKGKFWVNNHAHVLKGLDDLDTQYLCYALQHAEIDSYISGSTRPKITQGDLKKPPITAPPLKTRHKISKLVNEFDQKIDLNQKTNQTLEQMAQTLFKSWFADFDPVIDSALAAGTNVSDFPEALQQRAEHRKKAQQLAASPEVKSKPLPEDIRALFPSEFEQSNEPSIGIKGWIPKGWCVVDLSEITTELRRGISPKYLEEGGIQVINQKCIRKHEVNFSLCRRNNPELRKVAGRELLLGDLLVNSTGVGTLGRMAQVNILPEPTVVDSHVTVVRPDITKCPAHTFGQLMLAIERRVEALGEGSTGQTELSRKILSEQKVLLPPITISSNIEEVFKSYAEKQINNSVQITTLGKLRDTLLPKLISGELTIPTDTKDCA